MKTCTLFRAFSIRSSMKVWQALYCENEYERCERWRLVRSGKQVPATLLPNGRILYVPHDSYDADSRG